MIKSSRQSDSENISRQESFNDSHSEIVKVPGVPQPPSQASPHRPNTQRHVRQKQQSLGDCAQATTLSPRDRWFKVVGLVIKKIRILNAFLPADVLRQKNKEVRELLRQYKGFPSQTRSQRSKASSLRLPQIVGDISSRGRELSSANPPSHGGLFSAQHSGNTVPALRTIFNKNVSARTKADEDFMIEIMQAFPFLQKMDRHNQVEISKIMKLKDYHVCEIIIEKDSDYKYLCIILQGRVKFICTTDGMEVEICTYCAWDCFGQLALTHPDTVKCIADIVCTEDTVVLMVEKQEYVQHFRKLEDEETKARVKFFKTINSFRSVDDSELEPFVQVFQHMRLPHNKVVCKEGAKRAHVYIIKYGECQLLKKCQDPVTNEILFTEVGTLRPKDCLYEPAPQNFGNENSSEFRQARRSALRYDVSVVTTTFSEIFVVALIDLKLVETPSISEAWKKMQQIHATRTALVHRDIFGMYNKGQRWDTFKKTTIQNALIDKKMKKIQGTDACLLLRSKLF